MKKLVFVFTLIALHFQMNAQWSELTIRSYNQTPFNLFMDGELLAEHVTDVTITELNAGSHFLELVKAKPSQHKPYGFFPGQHQRLFKGTVTIPANQRIVAAIYQNQFIIQEQMALAPQVPPNYGSNHYGNGNPGQQWNDPYDNYVYEGYNPHGQYGNNQYGHSPNYIPGMNTHWNVPAPTCPIQQMPPQQWGPQPMSPASFDQLKKSIENQWFSSGQRDVFQQALATNYFTSEQVYQMVELFTFNSDQLEVAKQAYTKTVDPENYFIVSNALEFSSAVNALSSYIAAL